MSEQVISRRFMDESGRLYEREFEGCGPYIEVVIVESREYEELVREVQEELDGLSAAHNLHADQAASDARYIEEIESERDNWKQRAEAAEAVVERLPKMADGVPVTPLAKLFHPDYPEPFVALAVPTKSTNTPVGSGRYIDHRQCYSTREAAEAARQGGGEC